MSARARLAEDVEDGWPSKRGREEAAQGKGDYSTRVAPREGDGGQAGALSRWRPKRPDGVNARVSHALRIGKTPGY